MGTGDVITLSLPSKAPLLSFSTVLKLSVKKIMAVMETTDMKIAKDIHCNSRLFQLLCRKEKAGFRLCEKNFMKRFFHPLNEVFVDTDRQSRDRALHTQWLCDTVYLIQRLNQ